MFPSFFLTIPFPTNNKFNTGQFLTYINIQMHKYIMVLISLNLLYYINIFKSLKIL